jgi:uncharacterized protein (TIGR02453 family)
LTRAAPVPEPGQHFTAASLALLRALARHNERPWFEANRARYEALVRDPMRALVEELDVRLAAIAPEIVGDVRRSPLRPQRDTRFTHDKSPYKRHAGCLLFHRAAGRTSGTRENAAAAGFYFQLEPGRSLIAGGLWAPPRPTLERVRAAIAADQRGFEQAALHPAFRERFGALYAGDDQMLRRRPRGVAAGHPAEHWLRHLSFVGERALTDAEVTSPTLADTLAADLAALTPLVRWLNAAVGYAPARSR